MLDCLADRYQAIEHPKSHSGKRKLGAPMGKPKGKKGKAERRAEEPEDDGDENTCAA